MLPIGRHEITPAGIRYALYRHAGGKPVEVCFLHVKAPPTHWDLLRAPLGNEVPAQQAVKTLMARAAEPLMQKGIPCSAYLRFSGLVFAILDAAEELDCQEIVVPLPHRGWRKFFSRNVVETLRMRQRDIPVITVNKNGVPHPPGEHGT